MKCPLPEYASPPRKRSAGEEGHSLGRKLCRLSFQEAQGYGEGGWQGLFKLVRSCWVSEHLCVEVLSRPHSFTGQACPRCYWFSTCLGQKLGEEKELGYMLEVGR